MSKIHSLGIYCVSGKCQNSTPNISISFPGASQIYWCAHMRTCVSKIPPKQGLAFLKKTSLEHLNPSDEKNKTKQKNNKQTNHNFFKINISRPLPAKCTSLVLILKEKKKTPFKVFFVHPCIHKYIWVPLDSYLFGVWQVAINTICTSL